MSTVDPRPRRDAFVVTPVALVALLLAVVVLAASCGGGERPRLIDNDGAADADGGVLEATEITDAEDPEFTTDLSVVATASTDLVEVFSDPADGEPVHEMANPNSGGGPLVFLVERTVGEWHEVLLPIRPNGSTGWVRSADVDLAAHNVRVEVSLSDFDLKVFDNGELVLQAVIGVARENAPTPGGRYYVTELVRPIEQNTIYGRFAYGLSGFSETFETFEGGPGQLGIHGTNEPDKLGTRVSAGCIRLHDNDITRLVEFLPLGTPVEVFT